MAEKAKKWPVFETSNSQENDDFHVVFWIDLLAFKMYYSVRNLIEFSTSLNLPQLRRMRTTTKHERTRG